MARSTRRFAALLGVVLSILMAVQTSMPVKAVGNDENLQDLRGGIAALLNPEVSNSVEVANMQAKMLEFEITNDNEEIIPDDFVMVNVKYALNVRSEASEKSSKVGKIYKDCGGTVLERKDGWTKIKSGNLEGWALDQYLLYGDDAKQAALDVGRTVATVSSDTLRVREEPNTKAGVCGYLPQGEIVDVIENDIDDTWICVDYEGEEAYVLKEYVDVDFVIDTGKTNDEIKAQAKAKRAEKKQNETVNYGAFSADADTKLLLAALIHCEAGGEPYEGQVAVGAVVMNRVRSSAYPDTIYEVIYASGQFTPAMSGKVNRVLESGNIYESCIKAAEEALSGTSNVGDVTHFRRVNGREGQIIGNHVFY